jgi:hypothetical protein
VTVVASIAEYYENRDVDAHVAEVRAWLAEHRVVVPEPKSVALTNIEVSRQDFDGKFTLVCDGVAVEELIGFGLDIASREALVCPVFTSPLGAHATYSAIVLTDATRKAITTGLQQLRSMDETPDSITVSLLSD